MLHMAQPAHTVNASCLKRLRQTEAGHCNQLAQLAAWFDVQAVYVVHTAQSAHVVKASCLTCLHQREAGHSNQLEQHAA